MTGNVVRIDGQSEKENPSPHQQEAVRLVNEDPEVVLQAVRNMITETLENDDLTLEELARIKKLDSPFGKNEVWRSGFVKAVVNWLRSQGLEVDYKGNHVSVRKTDQINLNSEYSLNNYIKPELAKWGFDCTFVPTESSYHKPAQAESIKQKSEVYTFNICGFK